MPPGRRRLVLVVFTLASTFFVFSSVHYWAYISRTLAYASRPLWDKPDGPQTIIPHFHADGLAITPSLCELHGWHLREPVEGGAIEAWDAVLFSGEIDLLEIRMNELEDVIDKFFILESNRTFTGLPKALAFADIRSSERFSRFADKIVYEAVLGAPAEGDDPWEWEKHQRNRMNELLLSQIPSTGRPPIVVFSDVDEIPSSHTMRLLKACAFAEDGQGPLHLQMRTYLYSFEWPIGWGSWRAQVHQWEGQSTYYRHSLSSERALADAGWHCTYCFRDLDSFAAKMQGFSHADRLVGDTSLLSRERIQKVICEGKDIFNMLPEAYSYKDMIQLMNPEPSKSMTGIPKFLIENEQRFQFLLPGGCIRES